MQFLHLYICTVNVFYFDFILLEKETKKTMNCEFSGNCNYFLILPLAFNILFKKKTIKLWTVAFFLYGSFLFNIKLFTKIDIFFVLPEICETVFR